jgi:hypothetical protein
LKFVDILSRLFGKWLWHYGHEREMSCGELWTLNLIVRGVGVVRGLQHRRTRAGLFPTLVEFISYTKKLIELIFICGFLMHLY